MTERDGSVPVVFVQNTEDMEKNHETFLQGVQQDLRKEMAALQKKILMDTVGSRPLVTLTGHG